MRFISNARVSQSLRRNLKTFIALLSTTRRLTAAVIVALGLLAVGLTAATASASASPSAQGIAKAWSYVPEYSSGPALASGEVVSSTGTPLTNSTVVVFPVPVRATAGETLTPLARTATDAQGNFTVRIPAGRLTSLATSRSMGALNVHVVVFYPGGISQHYYTISSKNAALLKSGTTAKSYTTASARLILHAAQQTNPTASQAKALQPGSCEIVNSHIIKNISVTVASKESDASNLAATKIGYSTTTSMTLGAGISYTSDSSGFSASGQTTQSAGGSYAWPSLPSEGNNALNGQGQYTDTQQDCEAGGNYSTSWTLTQYYVGGTLSTPGITPVAAGDCSANAAGSKNTYTAGTQKTFSAGVSLAALGYGVNLSSQDGWSSESYIEYDMGSTGHPVCGVGYPPGKDAPLVLQVHSSVTT